MEHLVVVWRTIVGRAMTASIEQDQSQVDPKLTVTLRVKEDEKGEEFYELGGDGSADFMEFRCGTCLKFIDPAYPTTKKCHVCGTYFH